MKLKYKIFAIFSAIAVIPILLLTFFAFLQYSYIIDRRVKEISTEQQKNISEYVADSYVSVKHVMNFFTFASSMDSSLIKLLRPFSSPDYHMTDMEIYRSSLTLRDAHQSVFYNYKFLNGVYVYTPAGELISYSNAQNGTISQSYDPRNDDWYQDTLALNGRLYLSTLAIHPMFESNQESIFFAQAIRDPDTRKSLGILMIDCSPSVFDLTSINILGDSTFITLENEETGALYYSNLSMDTPISKKDLNDAIVTSIPQTPFVLSLMFDYDALRAEYNRVTVLMILFSVICIFCVILFTFQTSSNLIKPIQELSRQMLHSRDQHHLTFTDYSHRKDEIGTLYRQYHLMMEELDTSIKRDYQSKLIILDAQMKSLEARINSHFLFNTLEAINSMAELDENTPISTMSLALGNMFRYAIKTESELVTLQQELEHVHDYVAIQSIRFDHRFSVDIQVPSELLSMRILKLILQPLVENALQHGLNYCTSGDLISISASFEEPCLHITIKDNGQGISTEQLSEIQKKLSSDASFTELGHRSNQSIGLKNIQSRIELYYGKGYGLSIDADEHSGTTIQILIPVFLTNEGGPSYV